MRRKINSCYYCSTVYDPPCSYCRGVFSDKYKKTIIKSEITALKKQLRLKEKELKND